ncbi:MAG TPA: FecR family protein [Bacteriovoracaceae bacterium]|nr:FecR family protein [Bacteriovoracaceae bacterium]
MKIFFLLSLIALSMPSHGQIATLEKFFGKVSINSNAANAGQSLNSGDKVVAEGKKSWVQITFKDGSKMMARDGIFILKEPVSKKETMIELIKGVLFTYKSKGESSLKVKTKNAVMGIRGTKFYVEEKDNETYLCVCEGKVEISNEAGMELVSREEDVHVRPKEKPQKTKASKNMMSMALEGFAQMGL